MFPTAKHLAIMTIMGSILDNSSKTPSVIGNTKYMVSNKLHL